MAEVFAAPRLGRAGVPRRRRAGRADHHDDLDGLGGARGRGAAARRRPARCSASRSRTRPTCAAATSARTWQSPATCSPAPAGPVRDAVVLNAAAGAGRARRSDRRPGGRPGRRGRAGARGAGLRGRCRCAGSLGRLSRPAHLRQPADVTPAELTIRTASRSRRRRRRPGCEYSRNAMWVTVRSTPGTLEMLPGHQFGDRLVVGHPDDRDQVDVAGAGIDLIDARAGRRSAAPLPGSGRPRRR